MSVGDGAAVSARRRLFVVEDEALVAMMLEDMLEEIGHEVTACAGHMAEAADLARSGSFDAALLDVHVDGQEVYPIADMLKARGIPFAFATGYGEDGLAERYRDHPALSKPYSRNDLERILAVILV